MMSVVIGKTFGNLVVVAKDLDNTESKTKWLCMCSCGNTVSVRDNSLKTGNTKSCGCIGKKKLIERSKTHGLSNSKLYQTWGNMKSRCDNEKNDFYMSYGGRGISYQPSEEAFEVYKQAKEAYIKDVSNKWKDKIDPRAYEALINYQVEITD